MSYNDELQDISWFDLKYNWTGALVSRLAIDVSLIENVSLLSNI